LSENIKEELGRKYKVDASFYPKLDMDVDFPKGLQGEVEKIMQILKNNGFPATSENVYHNMEFKKKLLKKYSGEGEEKQVVEDYTNLLKQKQPVGSVVPIDYYLVAGLIGLLIYVGGKFGGSFLDEAGKITAQKLLNKGETKKHLQKEMRIDKNEYNLFANQIVVIIDKNGADLSELMNNLQKTKKVNAKSS
jgi:hypothetical protein